MNLPRGERQTEEMAHPEDKTEALALQQAVSGPQGPQGGPVADAVCTPWCPSRAEQAGKLGSVPPPPRWGEARSQRLPSAVPHPGQLQLSWGVLSRCPGCVAQRRLKCIFCLQVIKTWGAM